MKPVCCRTLPLASSFGLALTALLLASCPSQVTGSKCNTDGDCPKGQLCSDGTCGGSSETSCTSDSHCQAGQVCAENGFCAEKPQSQPCNITADCPLDQYCNTGMQDAICAPLLAGACRDQSQCNGDICSALAGGVGQCVECMGNGDCASGRCLPNGTCEGGGDAGQRTDAGQGHDATNQNDDPNCGGDSQYCCGQSSPQDTECDSGNMTCLYGFPGASDAYCWRSCTPTPCTTAENTPGNCHLAEGPLGYCKSTTASTCTPQTGCAQGTCILFSATSGYCFATGCDWRGDCGAGYYCSTFDNNLCLSTQLLLP